MAKFYGKIGYAERKETAPGVWRDVVTEREYYGDVLANSRRYESGEHLNDDLNINNRFSIVSDAYAVQHFYLMKYVEWMGTKWKISAVEVQHPRLILTVGGVYNAQQT